MIAKKSETNDLLWKNISSLPYFRGYLRAVEGRFYEDIDLVNPVLDVGIGDGHFSATTLPGQIEAGIDPSYRSLREAKSFSAANSLICANGDSLPFAGECFNTVISNSVLEHILDVDSVLKEINRLLKPGGLFVICVPNDNFTQNLSLARLSKALGLKNFTVWYQRLFNKISRHFHPDKTEVWKKRLEQAGFEVMRFWNYFSPRSLSILEWGHLFGIPSWVNKQLFGKWILIPRKWFHWPLYQWLNQHYQRNQKAENGAYTFFIMTKR